MEKSMPIAIAAVVISIVAVLSGVAAIFMKPTPTIGAGDVGTNELADDAVTGAKIADGTITGTDISDGSVTMSDLSSDVTDAITGVENIADNSITSAKIQDGTITSADLAAEVLAQMLSLPIATENIADGAVTEPKLDVLNIPTDNYVLSWDATQGKFEWVASSAGGISKFARSATIVVAANDSADKENADYVVPDGSTSAQTTINAALNALPTGGGVVYLAEGTYTIDGDIVIPKSNVTLVGAGASTVIKIKNSTNASINVIYSSSKTRVLIQNLRINGNKANQTAGTMIGIYFSGVWDSKIIDCWVEDLRAFGISFSVSDNNIVEGNTIHGNGNPGIVLDYSNNNTITSNNSRGNGSHGIYLYYSNNNTMTGNTLQGNEGNGIYLYYSNNNTVTSNTSQWNLDDGINLTVSNNNTITGNTSQGNLDDGINLNLSDNNTITSNTSCGNDYGILLDSSSNYNTVTGNTIQGNNLEGVLVYNSSNNTVSGNTSLGNGYYGIFLYSSDSCTISANTVIGNSQSATNTYDGIGASNSSDYNNIQGNTVRSGNETNKQRYGISIFSGVTGNLVINNDIYQAGVTGDYYNAGTGTIYHNNRTTAGWVA